MPTNFNKALPILALSLALNISPALAQSSICENSLQKICIETKEEMNKRYAYINTIKSEIAKEADANARPRIDEMKKKIKAHRLIKRMIESYKIKNQEIMKSAKKRVGEIETVVTSSENIAKIKGYMKEAIAQSSFDEITKLRFSTTVDQVVVGNFSDFIEKTNLENDIFAQLLMNACGSDGLVENAFATELNGEKYVLVCPGFSIALKQNASDESRFNTILQALAHEIGHHIDNGKFGNEIYAKYLTCIANNNAKNFNKTKDDKKLCDKKETTVELCNMKVAISHGGELVADQWGILVTALHAKKMNYSFNDAETLLTDSWVKLCGSGDEGIHPSGDFRIGTLMPTNPKIEEVLACQPKETPKIACSFDGEVIK